LRPYLARTDHLYLTDKGVIVQRSRDDESVFIDSVRLGHVDRGVHVPREWEPELDLLEACWAGRETYTTSDMHAEANRTYYATRGIIGAGVYP
jgi:hypothetical protein